MKYYAEIINKDGNIAVDDTILVKGAATTAGSKILDGFKPLFSAEAVTRLENAGYTVSGKTHVGEFGLDLAGEFSYYGEKDDTIKGAAAELVKEGKVKAAIGVDVNGAPRRAAALSGVCFLKPTYGTVSRYGIISTASSGETVGVYAKDADGVAEVMGVIAGHDGKDGTSLKDEKYDYTLSSVSGKRVCVIKELFDKADDAVKADITAALNALRAKGVTVDEVSFDLAEAANTAWQIIMSAETCNNVSRYDGVKYGHRAEKYKDIDELYTNTRTEGFNFLTKAVILYGSDVLSKTRYKDCFDKSLRVRRVVSDAIKEIFTKYDAIVTPVASAKEFASYDINDAFMKVFDESAFTATASLIGVPALALGTVQFIGNHFDEKTLLSLAKEAK